VIVRSFESFGDVREFDPRSGILTGEAGSGAAVTGQFGTLGDVTMVLYRSGDALFLRAGSEVLPLDDTVSASHHRTGDLRTLEISRGGEVRARAEYTLPPPIVDPEEDPTPFAEEEDFDFGLFLATVANDPARRSRMYHPA
jgi:hypothetical protein